MKYLGVTITSNLKWDAHISNIRNSADATTRFLKRNLRMHSRPIKESAYFTYVRPKAEYASAAWDPHTKTNIHKVEMIQRNAARWTLGKDGRRHREESVTQMLSVLGWRSLEQRRADTRLNLLYKIQNSIVKITNPDLRPITGMLHSTYPHRLVNFRKYTASQFNSFFPRTVRQWNDLDPSVALATPELFKSRVSGLQHRA